MAEAVVDDTQSLSLEEKTDEEGFSDDDMEEDGRRQMIRRLKLSKMLGEGESP